VEADVRAPRIVGMLLDRLARRFDRAQRDGDLGRARGIGELLDRLPIAVAGREVHAPVHAGGIALQHLLEQADALDRPVPVRRRDQA
jgi:hypothetical protein